METTMTYNKYTKEIGTVAPSYDNEIVTFIETESNGIMRIEGTTSAGEVLVAELLIEDYFEGKNFIAGKLV